MSSPTSRSLKLLRDRGFVACVVEQTVPGTFIKRDAFGFGDILAATSGQHDDDCFQCAGEHKWRKIALIQTTTSSNLAARRTKILSEPRAIAWLQAGGRIYLHGWSLKGGKGKRKLWTCREEEITAQDFDGRAVSSANAPVGQGE